MKFAIVLIVLLITLPSAYADVEHPEVGIDHILITVDDETRHQSHSAYRHVRKHAFEATIPWGMPTVANATSDAYIVIDVKLSIDLADDPDYTRCTAQVTATRLRDDRVLGKGSGYSMQETDGFDKYWKYCSQMSLGSAMQEIFIPVFKDVEREKRKRARKERRKRRGK